MKVLLVCNFLYTRYFQRNNKNKNKFFVLGPLKIFLEPIYKFLPVLLSMKLFNFCPLGANETCFEYYFGLESSIYLYISLKYS